MDSPKWTEFAAGAVILVIAGSGLWVATSEPAGRSTPTSAEINALQAQAGDACRCARRRRDLLGREECWAGFERNLARYRHEEMSSACAEESSTSICFFVPAGETPDCITREWPRGACNSEEARIAEARAGSGEGCG